MTGTVLSTMRVLLPAADAAAATAACHRLTRLTGTEVRSAQREPEWLTVRPRYDVELVGRGLRAPGEGVAAAFERVAQPIMSAFGVAEPLDVEPGADRVAVRFTDRWGLVAPGAPVLLEIMLAPPDPPSPDPASPRGPDGRWTGARDDPLAAWLTERNIGLAEFRRAETALKIVLLVDVNGLGRDAALSAAGRRLAAVPWEVGLYEPRALPDGLLRVACSVAMGEPHDTPRTLFDEFARDMVALPWTVHAEGPDLLCAGWCADRPRVGIVRLRVLIAVGAVRWDGIDWTVDESLAEPG